MLLREIVTISPMLTYIAGRTIYVNLLDYYKMEQNGTKQNNIQNLWIYLQALITGYKRYILMIGFLSSPKYVYLTLAQLGK